MTGRTTGVATYRNNDFFGLVDGLNFAVQYLGKNERDTARRSNGDGVGGSISYEYEGFGIVGAIYWAHLDRIFYGNDRKDAAAIGFDDDFIYQEMPLKPEQRHKTMQRLMGMEALKAFRMWEESADKTEY
jgi:predicted porin